MLSVALTIASLLFKVFGMAEQATAFEEKAAAARAVKKTAKAEANVPITKQEWLDAADKGDL